MFRKMVEPLREVPSVTRRLPQRGLRLQTSRRANIFFPAKRQIHFEHATYKLLGFTARISPCDSMSMLRLLSLGELYRSAQHYRTPYYGQWVL